MTDPHDGRQPGAGGDLTLEQAQAVLAAQPFSKLVGARVVEFGRGEAVLEVDIRDDLRQQHGFVHGGVLAYAADNALTFAGGSALGPAVLTGGFSITYLRPADGVVLRARAQVVDATSRQAICRCELSSLDSTGEPTLCASAQGTVISIRDAGHGASTLSGGQADQPG